MPVREMGRKTGEVNEAIINGRDLILGKGEREGK